MVSFTEFVAAPPGARVPRVGGSRLHRTMGGGAGWFRGSGYRLPGAIRVFRGLRIGGA